MRVLVTGASGYLGRAVVHVLHNAGYRVSALVHHASPAFPDTVEVHHGDVCDRDTVLPAVRGVDAVVHLVALTHGRESVEHPARFVRINTGGTANVLDALESVAAAHGACPRFVFTSTGAVYGTPERQPIAEDEVFAPQNPYAASKIAAEQLVSWQARAGSVATMTLRIFSLAGGFNGHADPDESRIIPRAIAAAAGRVSHVDINGDGSVVRDYVHVVDAATAVLAALEAAEPGQHRAFNVGATPASVGDIVKTVESVTGCEVLVAHHPAHSGDAPELRADTTAIRCELGWKPTRSALEDLVRDQWEAGGG